MLAVNFETDVLEVNDKKYKPILDSYSSINELIEKLQFIKFNYDVKHVFLAGHSIVGSCAHIGDYVCLVAELK